jgi:hypothetical protein
MDSLSETIVEIKERADWHLEQLNGFDKTDRNYKYHKYCRKQCLSSAHELSQAICLPSDFA